MGNSPYPRMGAGRHLLASMEGMSPSSSALSESGYTILRKIGSGGMGIVYLAEDGAGNDVALKLLRPEVASDENARTRLRREVAALQRVSSDQIARPLDAELDGDGAFIVTEFIPGPTLDEAVRRHGALHLEVVREIGVVLGEALQEIHAAGIIHRDLKPSNIMIRGARPSELTEFSADGSRIDPVIIDFGIAQAREDSRLTSTGLMMGTAAYLDPEVVRTNETGPEVDWWAWAGLIAFAATGRDPFGSGRPDVVFLRAERGEVDVDGLPAQLADWLRDALQPRVQDRPDPEDLIHRLARLDLDPATAVDAPAKGGSSALGAGGSRDARPVHPTVERPQRRDEPAADPMATARLDALDDSAGDAAADDAGEAADEAPRTEVLPVYGHEQHPTKALPVVPLESPSAPYGANGGVPHGGPVPTQPIHHQQQFQQSYAQQAQFQQVQPAQQVAPAPAYAPPQHRPVAAPDHLRQGYELQHYPNPSAHPGMAAPMLPPRRPWLVWLGIVLMTALGAIAPFTAIIVFLLVSALARTWQRTWESGERARARSGRSGGAGAVMFALPRFAVALLESILLAMFPFILGLVFVLAIDAVAFYGFHAHLPLSWYGAGIVGFTILLCWIGLSSRLTRNGAHRVVDAAAPDGLWTMIMAFLLLALLIAVGVTILARGGTIDYFPFTGMPTFDTLAFWRR